jgi:hypothetical protein
MTIKRTQSFQLPLLGNVQRTSVLRPGHVQTLKFEVADEDMRGGFEGKKKIRVISPDAVEVTVLRSHHLPYSLDKSDNIHSPQKPYTLEGEEIRRVIDERWGGKAWGTFGEEVEIKWEPTLSIQARK